jgi:hypothetical protein
LGSGCAKAGGALATAKNLCCPAAAISWRFIVLARSRCRVKMCYKTAAGKSNEFSRLPALDCRPMELAREHLRTSRDLLPGLRRAGGGYTFGPDEAEGLLLFHVKEHERMVRLVEVAICSSEQDAHAKTSSMKMMFHF